MKDFNCQSFILNHFKNGRDDDKEEVKIENKIINFFTTLKYINVNEIRISFEIDLNEKSRQNEQIVLELVNIEKIGDVYLIFQKINFFKNQEIYDFMEKNKLKLRSFKYYLNENLNCIICNGLNFDSNSINEKEILKKITNFYSKLLLIFNIREFYTSYSMTIGKILIEKVLKYLKKNGSINYDFCVFIKFSEDNLISFGLKFELLKEKLKSISLCKNNYPKSLKSICLEYIFISTNKVTEMIYNLPVKFRKIKEFSF